MNILNNMEAVFVATAALAVSAMFMPDPIQAAHAQPVVTSASKTMAVVVVKAKRMSAEEKLKSVQLESTSAAATEAASRA